MKKCYLLSGFFAFALMMLMMLNFSQAQQTNFSEDLQERLDQSEQIQEAVINASSCLVTFYRIYLEGRNVLIACDDGIPNINVGVDEDSARENTSRVTRGSYRQYFSEAGFGKSVCWDALNDTVIFGQCLFEK